MSRISPLFVQDLLKSKVVLGYGFFLAAVGWGIFLLENSPEKALLALLQVSVTESEVFFVFTERYLELAVRCIHDEFGLSAD